MSDALKQTPLHALHQSLVQDGSVRGLRDAVQYPDGIRVEHAQTRAKAGLFDVSHMGQVRIEGADAAAKLESLVTGDLQALKPGRTRYTLLTNEAAGILDDLMVTRWDDHLFVVVNAANKEADIAHMTAALGGAVVPLTERALIALQGPAAERALAALAPEVADLVFLQSAEISLGGTKAIVTRSGYTGEDGYEISVPAGDAEALAAKLLAHEDVAPVGLGARDSLRLEAGLCLHGHDIDPTTTPVEANLVWAVGKRRGTEGGFPGHSVVMQQLADGPARRRVGLRPQGRAPAREGTRILSSEGADIGVVTSGGFGLSVEGTIAMGYVATDHAATGTALAFDIRGKAVPGQVADLPFITPSYKR